MKRKQVSWQIIGSFEGINKNYKRYFDLKEVLINQKFASDFTYLVVTH